MCDGVIVGVPNYEVVIDLTHIDEDFKIFEEIREKKMLGRLECHNFIFAEKE